MYQQIASNNWSERTQEHLLMYHVFFFWKYFDENQNRWKFTDLRNLSVDKIKTKLS